MIGFAIANLGLETIIQYSVPVLQILYPIIIAIVMIVIVNKFVALSKIGMQLTVAVVTAIAFTSIIGQQFKLTALINIINTLPLAQASIPWLIPTVIGIIVSLFLPNKQKSDTFEME